MKTKWIILLSLPVLLFSCRNQQAEKQPAETAIQAEPTKQEEHHHHNDAAISLNHGEKWKVDDSMMVYIRDMENAVTGFKSNTAADYKDLAGKLKKNIELLTTNCTMQGEAHDELHKWLVPYIELADQFYQAKSEQEAGEYYQEIKSSFQTFNQYFQ